MNTWFPRITVHTLAIALSLLAYVLTTRAEHERRPPSIAIAWVLGMIALPYLALPMYLMFGRRKLQRKISPWSGIRSDAENWAEQLIESFGLPGAAPSIVRMHQNGAEARSALFEIMSRAQERLDICTFILGKDPFGEEIVAHMIACGERGVRVRFLIDGVDALQIPRSWFRRLHAARVETAVFSPLLARKTQGPRNLRNHRKWVVADGSLLWTGGRNLAGEYFCGLGGAPPWLDLSFDLKGAVAAAVANQFEADWAAAGGRSAGRVSVSAAEHTGGRAQFLPSGPDQTEDTVHALLIDACFHATQRMLVATPYFVPDASLETAMRLAARRGVKIDLVIPAKSNHRLADFARSRALRSLSSAGVSIHLLRGMNHAKAVVFDQSVAICGSPNIDSRSLLLNYESAVVFYGAQEIAWLARWIQALIPDAAAFDNRAPGLWRDLCEGLLLTVAYQL
ncbi:MAG: phospholipase D-like domain-containing protein [Steroidobacteraceae bacterium]